MKYYHMYRKSVYGYETKIHRTTYPDDSVGMFTLNHWHLVVGPCEGSAINQQHSMGRNRHKLMDIPAFYNSLASTRNGSILITTTQTSNLATFLQIQLRLPVPAPTKQPVS